MLADTPVGWVALAAFLVGLVVRLLKTDQFKIALANLGLPPVPTRALPWVALVLGGAAAVLDARVDGASWDVAAQAGVAAAALAVFGHELGSGVPGVKKLLSVALVVVPLSAGTSGCHLLTPDVISEVLDKTRCAVEHMNLSEEQIIARCLLSAEEAPRVMASVRAARSLAAQQAAGARADERARMMTAPECSAR